MSNTTSGVASSKVLRLTARLLLAVTAILAGAASLVLAAGPLRPAMGPLRLSLTSAPRLFTEAAVAFLLWVIWFRATRVRVDRVLATCAVAALALGLGADSEPRRVGDGAEYMAMALRASEASPPALTPAELERVEARISAMPGFDHAAIAGMTVQAPDHRRVFVHFWLYPILAAPFVRAANALSLHVNHGFFAFNVLCLALAAWVVVGRAGIAVAVLILCGPLLWWVDKTHTELFIVSCLAVGFALLRPAPGWALVACAAAAAQNLALLPIWAGALGVSLRQRGWRDRRLLPAALVSGALCLAHPAYYLFTVARWSPLRNTLLPHVPGVSELLAPLLDPNLGILVHAPVFAAALLFAGIVRGRRGWDEVACLGLAAALMTLAIATQAPNVNHGGTFNPSRYGLWLVPMLGAILWPLPLAPRWAPAALALLASLSLAASVLLARPERGENYLRHDAFAQALLTSWPTLYSPLPELFVERTIGLDDVRGLPVAFGACSRILLAGAGSSPPVWPVPCAPAPLPEWCRPTGALCYATPRDGIYVFGRVPYQPAFLASSSPYGWTSTHDFDWLEMPIDWAAMRIVRAGATLSWVRRAHEVRFVHTAQGGTQLVAWIEPFDAPDASVTVLLPARGRACAFDLASRTRLSCQDIEAGVETTMAVRGGARTLLAIDSPSS